MTAPQTVHNPVRLSPWAMVGLLWIAWLLNYTDRQAAFSMLPALRASLGFTQTQLALVGTIFIWVYSLSMPIAGRLADRYSPRLMIAGSIVLFSIATLGSGLSTSPAAFLFWRGAMGLTEALYFPAAAALLASLHTTATRSRALAIHQSAQFAGGAVGGWFGGWSADEVGWQQSFYWLGAVGILYAVLLAFTLPGARSKVAESRSGILADVVAPASMRWLLVAFFFNCGVLWMLLAWLPNHVYERFALSMTASGAIATTPLQISSFVGALVGGYLGDRQGGSRSGHRMKLTSIGFLLCPAFAVLAFAAPAVSVVMAATVGFGLMQGIAAANIFSGARDVVPARSFGLAAGLLNAGGGLAGGIGILAAGNLRAVADIATVVAFAAAATILCAFGLWRASRRVPQLSTI